MLLKRCFFRYQALCKFSNLSFNIKKTLSQKPLNNNIIIKGWVQSIRRHKNLYFVDVIDGSCFDRLQVVIEADDKRFPTFGSSIEVQGELVKSNHRGQDVELICKSWTTLGTCSDDYPFSYRVKHSSEYIRQFLHLRPKTKSFASILRVRSCASQAIHQYFQNEGFYFIHSPLITANDCEGAGEVFSVQPNKKINLNQNADTDTSHLTLSVNDGDAKAKARQSFFEQTEDSEEEIVSVVENEDEFFGRPVYLSVSGQLHLEATASALSRVYNFGPVFRAEHSRSRQHASEFYMIEAEIAFIESLDALTQIVESCIKSITASLLKNCPQEIDWINEKHANTYKEYIERVTTESFVTMSYSEAVEILKTHQNSFMSKMEWGKDFTSEHKQCLLKHCDNIPVIVTMFPAATKPFYMKEDSQGLAYCFDVFAPFGGEICGGSLREDSEQRLQKKLENLGMEDKLSWYLDLRKFGGVPTGGFGIGFDRMLQSILGISNIRDVIPFPRRKNDCKC